MAGLLKSLTPLSRINLVYQTVVNSIQRQSFPSLSSSNISATRCFTVSSNNFSEIPKDSRQLNFQEAPSPYRKPGPRRFGYQIKLHQGGLLPRSETAKSVELPRYKAKDPWTQKKALFGQNDYIDILGDGDIRPFDLLTGPRWLLGFRGHEMQRVIRQLKFDGPRLKYLYPTEFRNLNKRLRFLYKKFNHKRSKMH